jgi:hypothetical protein
MPLPEDNTDDLIETFEELGLIQRKQDCTICGQPTRNLWHCEPVCLDCEEALRRGE